MMISCGAQLVPQFLPYRGHIGQVKKNIQVFTHPDQFINTEVFDAACFSQSQSGRIIVFHDGDDLYTFVGLPQQFFKKSRAHFTQTDDRD